MGSFIAGSFFTNFEEWIKDPRSAVTIIGTSAPLTSIFFLNYIEFGVSRHTSLPVNLASLMQAVDNEAGKHYIRTSFQELFEAQALRTLLFAKELPQRMAACNGRYMRMLQCCIF